MRRLFLVLLLLLLPLPAAAQRAAADTARPPLAAGAFVAAGGSVAGLGVGVLAASRVPDHCGGSDPISCAVDDRLLWLWVGSMAGSVAGAQLVHAEGGGRPSLVGNLLGAAVGSYAGLAAAAVTDSGIVGIGIYSLVQGVITAAGGRLLQGRRPQAAPRPAPPPPAGEVQR